MSPLSDRNGDGSQTVPHESVASGTALDQLQKRLHELKHQRQLLKHPELKARLLTTESSRPSSAVPSSRRMGPQSRPRVPHATVKSTVAHADVFASDKTPCSSGRAVRPARPATAGAALPAQGAANQGAVPHPPRSARLGRGSFGPACGIVTPLFSLSSSRRLDIRESSSTSLEAERERLARVHLQRKLVREGHARMGLPFPTITQATALEPLLYRQEKVLGKGAFGLVTLARSVVTGELVAMKTIDRAKLHSENLKKAVEHEIRILKRLAHRHIVKLLEVFETPRSIHIIMEYVDGGTMQQLVKKQIQKRIDETDAQLLMCQLVDAVACCHEHHVCHRDLKLENFMLSRDGQTLKLIDFGLSVVWKQGLGLFKSYGTPCYMAPEIIRGGTYFGAPVDIWSLGVALSAMLTGTLPFQGAGDTELKKRILRGHFSCPEYVSCDARDLISRMLEVDPAKRITIDAVRRHPWLSSAVRRSQPCHAKPNGSEADLDQGILSQLEHLGFDLSTVEHAVRTKTFSHEYACYEMLLVKQSSVCPQSQGADLTR